MSQGQTSNNAKSGLTNRYRNWSIMLVGDHGRVIPLRRFKALAIIFVVLIFLLIALSISLLFLNIRHIDRIQLLQERLHSLELKAENLQKERDVYLAKMIIEQDQQQTADTPVEEEKTDIAAQIDQAVEPRAKTDDQIVKPVESPQSSTAALPSVKWDAAARDVTINYDVKTSVLSVTFRVYNTSKPKKKLSGRCIVILKPQDEPPVKWLALPSVPLSNGNPDGTAGYSFRINNYRTIELQTQYDVSKDTSDSAVIYIFSSDGLELFRKEYPFTVDYPSEEPAPKPAPPSPASKRAPVKAETPEPMDLKGKDNTFLNDALEDQAPDSVIKLTEPGNDDSSANANVPATSSNYFMPPATQLAPQQEIPADNSPVDNSIDSETHNPTDEQGDTH